MGLRHGSTRCGECGDQTASICEACAVETRGPLGTFGVRVENRTTEAGEEVRVAAEVYWDGIGDSGGGLATMYSDWVEAQNLEEAPIAEIVASLRPPVASRRAPFG